MCQSSMSYTTSVQYYLYRNNKESFQLWNAIRVIGYEFACASNLASALKYISFLKA